MPSSAPIAEREVPVRIWDLPTRLFHWLLAALVLFAWWSASARHIDGHRMAGSAVAGLRDCWTQRAETTPRPTWNPDIAQPINFLDGWQKVPDYAEFDNAFKIQWELFLRHVVDDEPFPWTLLEGAKGVQLAEKGLESWARRAWVDLEPLA